MQSGLKAVARLVANTNEQADDQWLTSNAVGGWDKNQDLYQLLKRQTSGDGRQAVLGAPGQRMGSLEEIGKTVRADTCGEAGPGSVRTGNAGPHRCKSL